jgi:uncharacterized protein (TIGR01777 family)
MRIAITGATGTIGRALCARLLDLGEQPVALSRDAGRAKSALGDRVEVHEWADPSTQLPPAAALAGADAVVHLLGEPIDQRWTPAARRSIRDSRVLSTRKLVECLTALDPESRPPVLVSQSAIGYYGSRDAQPLDEGSPAGSGFVADVVASWEAEARRAEQSLRVVLTRTGVVLSRSGGALAKMLPFFRLGIGGPVGSGRQYVSWIHLDDVVGALIESAAARQLEGPVNVTAPDPATNRDLSRALGRALQRPAVLPVPSLALKALYGDMAEIVLTGQRVIPRKLQDTGYSFRHPDLDEALRDVISG